MAKMTIGQCIDAAFQLLNQYSIAGTVTPLSYNDQRDDQNRMVNLINDAQMQIATSTRPIDASYEFEVSYDGKGSGIEEIKIAMPDDFIYATAVMFKADDDGRWRPIFTGGRTIDTGFYRWLNDNTLIVPSRPSGRYRVEYARYPERYDPDVDLDTELDNTPDTHEAIPYFIAAMIYIDENPYAYAALNNQWEIKLSRMGYKPPHAVNNRVEDVYGFDLFRGTWD